MFRNFRRALLGLAVTASSIVAIPVATSVVSASDGTLDNTTWGAEYGGRVRINFDFNESGGNVRFTATGDLSQSATLPSSIGVGDHTLVVASGNTYAVMGLRVVPSSLPTTGLTEGSGRTMVIALFTLVFAVVLVRSRRLTLLAR